MRETNPSRQGAKKTCVRIRELATSSGFLLISPADEKETVLVGILKRDETPTPVFIRRRRQDQATTPQLVIVSIDIIDSYEKVSAPATTQHGFEVLSQSDLQTAGSQG